MEILYTHPFIADYSTAHNKDATHISFMLSETDRCLSAPVPAFTDSNVPEDSADWLRINATQPDKQKAMWSAEFTESVPARCVAISQKKTSDNAFRLAEVIVNGVQGEIKHFLISSLNDCA